MPGGAVLDAAHWRVMRRDDIDPRFFGDLLGYNRAVLLGEPQRWLVVAGHEARDDEGNITAVGDMDGQIRQTLHRMDLTLARAGFTLGDVVQIRIFTTDLNAMKAHYATLLQLLAEVDCRPVSLLAEVSALSDPDMLIEIEALAAR